jgi:DNA-binding PadR family transcriptional regulator
MNTLSYMLLSLLAREPMSGYDLTARMKLQQRFVPFWPISHTQIYPALAQLEQQGLLRYHIVDQQGVRPNKKVYELTEEGRAALRQWVESPTPLAIVRDEFFVKAYSLWLADPERMMEIFRDQAQHHKERLERYEERLEEKRGADSASLEKADLIELTDLLFQYAIGYEQNYHAWCQSALRYLEQRKLVLEEEK